MTVADPSPTDRDPRAARATAGKLMTEPISDSPRPSNNVHTRFEARKVNAL
jgi:hypothetical protein